MQTINDIRLRGYVLQEAGYLPLNTYILPMCNYTQLMILAKALPCILHGTVRRKRTYSPAPKDLFRRFAFFFGPCNLFFVAPFRHVEVQDPTSPPPLP